ncbi:DUF1983 domain-containing protein [Enterobacter hormaechei]|uniref:phage tail tip fiber protein n=1 Tax=Enterobacter hormaechei TaxID=158836 RepID=UPI00020CECC2|nr:DUF1983 domain-containing protein [Enterobacter hormaechei]MBT1781955.1 DUF1983 domain-containing protein [Enterobacter hormaechei subsp. xiangfangensis]EGK59641.1 hypothetical protein HMPREF9086_2842 [Enterobacter hormaechei ATCC 49162]ELD3463211.1 DUF1983 domain-containing protein [Enterobacter hormaechei]KZR22836.1 hypothetical protein A3N67_03250 [Enterobacter hormaechei subsp. steigerwaltii]OIR52034.1 hypothetical protein BH712_00140 [Enterobacter hormaechei ATCC 49162]
MKHLSLQQAMLGLRIVQTDHGMIIKSPAGSAEYDLKGRRTKVSGYPEYFPGQLRVKDMRTKTRGRVEMSGGELTAYGEDGSVRMRVGRINPPAEQKLVDEILKSLPDTSAFRDLLDETYNYGQLGTVTINTANFIHNYLGESDPRLMSGPDSDESAKAAWSIKGHTDDAGVVHVAGMGVAVEDGQQQVEFKADRFAVIGAALSTIKSALHAAEVKTRLSDDMREAVIDAIRESDVFKALQASQDAQASALVTTQQAIEQAASDAIRNALKPGGLLYRP